MYTGRILELGTLVELDPAQVTLQAPKAARSLEIGGSFNVQGVCLSAVRIENDLITADASPETRRRTRLDELEPGARLNVELPLQAGEPLDGHLVQGHVDACAKVVRVEDEPGGARRIWLRPPRRVRDQLTPKGSISVDGVSLTVADLVRDRFSVALIPTTLAETSLDELTVDDRVHVETDVLAKFVDEADPASAARTNISSVLEGLGWSGALEGRRGVEQAVAQLAAGGGVVVWDPSREGEGDVIFAGEQLRPETMAFLLTHARGHTTVPCASEVLERCAIPPMAGRGDRHGTAYHNSIDLASASSTGVSAHDRAATIRRLADAGARPDDFLQPGHVFPLRGRPGGPGERAGHTEAAIWLCEAAGLAPVAVICEVMGDDGHMLGRAALERWSLRHGLPMVCIADIVAASSDGG